MMLTSLFYNAIFTRENTQPSNVVVKLLSRVQLFATPWTAACQASLSFTISQNLLKLMSIESVQKWYWELEKRGPLLYSGEMLSNISPPSYMEERNGI